MNDLIISYLKKLESQAKQNQEIYRERAFQKARNIIAKLDFEISDVRQLKNLSGIGTGILRRIEEILENQSLSEIDEEVVDQKQSVINEFLKIMGVGKKTAETWYTLGYRTLKDVLKKAKLTNAQKIGIKYFKELEQKIPRNIIDTFNEKIQIVAKEVRRKFRIKFLCVIAGSYRRNSLESGDIDCLLSVDDSKLSDDVIDYFLKKLKEIGIITDDLGRGESKFSGICEDFLGVHRRIDFEFVRDNKSYPYELLYFTGGQQLNMEMRHLAKEKGMMLNQKGLYKNGLLIPAKNEREIFRKLGMEYLPPEERY